MAQDNARHVLPQCCSVHRLAALDALEVVLTNDVLTSFDRMIEGGWPHEAAVDCLRTTYRTWLLGRIEDAIDVGLGVLEMEMVA